MNIGRILPTEAAAILNVSPQFVRVAMQQGKLPIGTAVQMSSIWTYHISEKLLADYSGKNIETIAVVVLVIRAEEEDATRKENLRLRPYKRQQQRSEKMRFYHAAPKETMMKIYAEGVLKKSWDGVVYMCKDPIDACKFLVIRGMRQMSVIELELDEKEVEESHDHSET